METSELAELASLPLDGGSQAGFSRAVDVLTRQTHVVNRRVAAALLWPLSKHSDDITDSPPGDPLPSDVTAGESPPDDVISGDSPPSDVTSCGSLPGEVMRLLCSRLGVGSVAAAAGSVVVTAVCCGPEAGRRLSVRKVVPRQTGAAAEWDLVIAEEASVAFVPLQERSRLIPPFLHRFELTSDSVRVLAPPSLGDAPSARWLSEHALPKMTRWTVDMATESVRPQEGSLQLVHPERYNTLYKELKAKYGTEFIKIWPENTDPLKFVHEDVAIASYLLLIWEEDRRRLGLQRRQSFVDIGCGNGLLVHILCSEGHPGYGIDIRSRAIWRLYPETTRLQVGTVTPSAETTYPDTDWLIGNHSDELTPWIPVMTAATGPHTCFFLLPCCPWDFYSKYQRSDTRLSQYEEYMQYVYRLSERCGFAPERDRLRIPSTRRRCILGRRRTAAVSTADLQSVTAAGTAVFRPRAAVPPVRNCTQLPGDTVAAAVRQVALRLVADGADGAAVSGEPAGLTLPAVAELLGGETLGRLRQQCGGLKTLLKNHAMVFRVRGDRVTLQDADWLRADPDTGRPELTAALKTSRCWQHEHLPAGCPLPAEQCRYAHGEQELRSRPRRTAVA